MEFFFVRPGRVADFLPLLETWRAVVLDCETSGLDLYVGDYILGFALAPLSPSDGDVYYFPVAHPDEENTSKAELQNILWVLDNKRLVGHNVKFDMHALSQIRPLSGAALYDVLVLARLLSPDQHPALDLKSLSRSEIGYVYSRSDVMGQRHRLLKTKFTAVDIGFYCCEDVDATRKLYHHLKGRLTERLSRLFAAESRLTSVLYAMERRGILYDSGAVAELSAKVGAMLDTLLEEIRLVAGVSYNPRSAPQTRRLMGELGLTTESFTAKGGATWNRKALVAAGNATATRLAQYRALAHLKSNFVARLEYLASRNVPAIRASWKNWGTVTGRMSAELGMHNQPKGWLQLNGTAPDGSVLYWSEDGDYPE